jgi:hypothetical protein
MTSERIAVSNDARRHHPATRGVRMRIEAASLGLCLLLAAGVSSCAPRPDVNPPVPSETGSSARASTTEQELVQLSRDKWRWMADKDVARLEPLFHDQSKFVHMSGTWKKDEELEIIRTGSIWYRQADVHDVAVEVVGSTALVWSRITLHAVVRGNEAKTEFTVTEAYQRRGTDWKLLALTFSSVRDTHTIRK